MYAGSAPQTPLPLVDNDKAYMTNASTFSVVCQEKFLVPTFSKGRCK